MIHASSPGPGRMAGVAAAGSERRDLAARADDGAHGGLGEDELGPLVGVLGVDRHIGSARREDGEDRDVQVGGAGRHPYADTVADADSGVAEAGSQSLDLVEERAVAEGRFAVVDGEGIRVTACALVENVEEGALAGGGSRR